MMQSATYATITLYSSGNDERFGLWDRDPRDFLGPLDREQSAHEHWLERHEERMRVELAAADRARQTLDRNAARRARAPKGMRPEHRAALLVRCVSMRRAA